MSDCGITVLYNFACICTENATVTFKLHSNLLLNEKVATNGAVTTYQN